MKFWCNQWRPPRNRDGEALETRWEPDPKSYTGGEIEVEYRFIRCGHVMRRGGMPR